MLSASTNGQIVEGKEKIHEYGGTGKGHSELSGGNNAKGGEPGLLASHHS